MEGFRCPSSGLGVATSVPFSWVPYMGYLLHMSGTVSVPSTDYSMDQERISCSCYMNPRSKHFLILLTYNPSSTIRKTASRFASTFAEILPHDLRVTLFRCSGTPSALKKYVVFLLQKLKYIFSRWSCYTFHFINCGNCSLPPCSCRMLRVLASRTRNVYWWRRKHSKIDLLSYGGDLATRSPCL